MKRRSIESIHPALRDDIADLTTYRALPTQHVEMIDPFLFLNHHGHQVYAPHNRGLPFGPHPHRGFETVTFIVEGDIAHRDSGGHESIIDAGGVQWMTAGRGLVHSETSSAAFKARGGPLEILQLWVNLPAALKMTQPAYIGLQRDAIPMVGPAPGVELALIAGRWEEQQGPITPLVDITVMTIALAPGAGLRLPVAPERNVFFYVVRGSVMVNGVQVAMRNLVDFARAVPATSAQPAALEAIDIESLEQALILFCHAAPFGEPVVSHGPFVMNTRGEIGEAIADYQAGRFGA